MRRAGASIYPAVQNIILACRAFGLGTLITTNHMLYEDEVKAVLGLRTMCRPTPRCRSVIRAANSVR
jgi:nitroreductase